MTELLNDKLNNLPKDPGIYQFKNEKGKVLYVGKAKNLRNRVRSYFHSSVNSPKTLALVNKIKDLELIVTDSEMEALVLENNLIKELRPRYNVLLKDDKTFPYIRVTNEPYPQIYSTRSVIKDGSKYFGPYTDVKSMKNSLRMINRLFKIRSCKYYIDAESIEKKKIKVCLDYHIKKCDGPCEGLISQKDYNDMVNQVIKLLRGKTNDLLNEFREQMKQASAALNFELAAELRDKIEQLEVYSAKQKIVSSDGNDRDIISAATEGRDVAATILNIRDGKLVGKRQLNLTAENNDELDQIYNSIIKFYYSEYVEIPKEIIVETNPEDLEAITEWLNTKSDRSVKFIVPQRMSEAMSLLNMCKHNANLQLKEIQLQRMKKEGNVPYVLSSLKRDLRLKNLPRKIECFDISHIQGSDTVASMVVFVDGKPKKSLYRKFIIKEVEGVDDFASMREVVRRRYQRVKEENEAMPDLIIIDGGKGQLSAALEILRELDIRDQEIFGLAKRLEEIFMPGLSEAQTIPKTSSSLKLIQAVRDEAHRFAITFHRLRRDKRTLKTELTDIPGIGEKIAAELLKNFESIDHIRNAPEEKLQAIAGKAKAKIIREFYDNLNKQE